MPNHRLPERHRLNTGQGATTEANGFNGVFLIPHPRPKTKGQCFQVIISDQLGYKHASVTFWNTRAHVPMKLTPTWDDMCLVKEWFWDPEDCVVQYHPPRSMYVNNHPHCLHLWQPTKQTLPVPHPLLVGLRGYTLGPEGKQLVADQAGQLGNADHEIHQTADDLAENPPLMEATVEPDEGDLPTP